MNHMSYPWSGGVRYKNDIAIFNPFHVNKLTRYSHNRWCVRVGLKNEKIKDP